MFTRLIRDAYESETEAGTAQTFPADEVLTPHGTAQVFTIKQTDSTRAKIVDERRRDHAWFIAFAPVESPKIAIAVLVENGGFGGATAAPIAQKVLDAYLLGADAAVEDANKVPRKAAL